MRNVWRNTLLCLLVVAIFVMPISAVKNSMTVNEEIFVMNLSQPPTVEWTKTYGGTDFDYLTFIIPTKDEGYLLAGKTFSWSKGSGDVWLIKVDKEGNEIWNTSFGGSGMEGGPDGLFQLDDGSFIIPTTTESYGSGNFDTWLIKTDNEGNMIWNKTYGTEGIDGIIVYLSKTNDGGYLLSGTTDSYGAGITDAWVIKTDRNGKEIWNKTYGGPEEELCLSMEPTNDGIILCGVEKNPIDICWLMKIDNDGTLIWENTLKGKIGYSWGRQAYQTEDGGYIVVGDTNKLYFGNIWLGKSDIWLVKTDEQGNKLWDKTIGKFIFDDSCTEGGTGGGILPTTDGGYIITGYTRGIGGFISQQSSTSKKACIIKTDANGNIQWEEHVGNGLCTKALEIDDSIFVVGGIEKSGKSWDGMLIKLN